MIVKSEEGEHSPGWRRQGDFPALVSQAKGAQQREARGVMRTNALDMLL
jgi:hypothetical protein